MAEFSYILTPNGCIGILPCGEMREFKTTDEYYDAYKSEEDEMVDELFRLEEERFVDYPDDYIYA